MLWNKYEILRLLKSFHGEKHSINTSLSKTFIFLLLIPQIPSTEMHVVMCWIKTMTKKSKLKLTLFHTQVQPEHTQLQQLFDSPTWNSGFLFLCSGQQSSHQQTNWLQSLFQTSHSSISQISSPWEYSKSHTVLMTESWDGQWIPGHRTKVTNNVKEK